jgi:hypothetical protein
MNEVNPVFGAAESVVESAHKTEINIRQRSEVAIKRVSMVNPPESLKECRSLYHVQGRKKNK